VETPNVRFGKNQSGSRDFSQRFREEKKKAADTGLSFAAVPVALSGVIR